MLDLDLSEQSLLSLIAEVQTPASVGQFPTAIEHLENLSQSLGLTVYIKRDDQTGVQFGGNKVRQLRYYLGDAVEQSADTLLITGAVQSNFARTAAALGRRLGMHCHIQLENRVPDRSSLYHQSGNVLLDNLHGAVLHEYPDGEDESGADASLKEIANSLKTEGRRPYIIPLGIDHAPLGALGYIEAAVEFQQQVKQLGEFEEIFIASGSALTHAGLLFGLRALNNQIPVTGICVRRSADLQFTRVSRRLSDIAELLKCDNPVKQSDISVVDSVLSPGYGLPGDAVLSAIRRLAESEGILVDPVYTGKVFAGLLSQHEASKLRGKRIVFWHTGGCSALFAYADFFGSVR